MIPYCISFKSCLTQFSIKRNGKIQGCQKASTEYRVTLAEDSEYRVKIDDSGSKVQTLNLESKLMDDSGSYVQIGQEFKTVL